MPTPALSLRHKILIILVCYIVGILVISVVSQKDLLKARNKLEAVELAYSLNSIILEVRRTEKNFLLYGTREDLADNSRQLHLALETTDTISEQARKLRGHPMILQLRENIFSYQRDMKLLSKNYTEGNILELSKNERADRLRTQGQEMLELSRGLVSFEHQQIRRILEQLVNQLFLWSIAAIGIGVITPFLVFLKVLKPLRIIKKATEDIAQGRFDTIEVLDTKDEMQQVMEAYNTMVQELQRRQDQLVQSQKLSSIGTLTAGIAHQLNNPLNNISTSCQIATKEFDSDDPELIRKMLRNIDLETTRARDVVQGLLEFSRAREFAIRSAKLAVIVDRAVKLVKSQIPAGVKLKVSVDEDLTLPMDTQRIQEVLLNMIINASHAIRSTGSIDISARVDKENKHAIITVKDTGIGIPKEIQDRLFDPFFTTKEEGQGTGLGLSIAYGIIQKHHGTISVASKPNRGTTFSIQLPMQLKTSDTDNNG